MKELHVHTVAGVHTFSKNLEAITKEKCQKSDIQEVHNLNFRHCFGGLANKI